MSDKHEQLTQQFSTWGDKLLQHADVLNSIQNEGVFKPITVQLALTEVCQSDCAFCSVANRPISSHMSFAQIEQCLRDFRALGAKSIELTGGGNPLLYRDRKSKHNVNDVVRSAASMGYKIGIITNSENLSILEPALYNSIDWIRISLIRLDEGKEPEDYNFNGFPYEKLGLSYIIYDECLSTPIRGKYRPGTTEQTIAKIARLFEMHEGKLKFVRFAGDALIKGNNAQVRKTFQQIIDQSDTYKKFFLKTIDENDQPFDDGCYVGLTRPYIAPSPDGLEYLVYACTSHVLEHRTYHRDFSLCGIEEIISAWARMNERFRDKGAPYDIRGGCSVGWATACKSCFYYNNNKILHTVAHKMPDGEFA